MKKVAIIGAGASGLAAAKACKEEDIDYVCFERSGRFGGLWNYCEDDCDDMTTVMKSTVINSSKEMSSFSDFPAPKEFPNYMHNRQMLRYLRMYAEKHSLLQRVRYHQEVTNMEPAEDYDEAGRWSVVTRDTKDGILSKAEFDGVMICTGQNFYPHIPRFDGQESYTGKIIHTRSLKVPDAYKDQRVLIIGIGNSGLDAAVEISGVAKQVYLSTRRGTWIMSRLGKYGLPSDLGSCSRKWAFLLKCFGIATCGAYIQHLLNEKLDHATYHLKPKHNFLQHRVTINDHIADKILSGIVVLKADVERFVEKGVVFQGDESETQVDAVVLATGYKIMFPFISEQIIDVTENPMQLYKYVFPPQLKHPSLAVIGLIQPFGPFFPVLECQSRWYAQVLKGRASLPVEPIMLKDIEDVRKRAAERYIQSERHSVQVDYVPYMDDLASQFGAKPNLLRMAFTDPVLFYHCFFGPGVAYQYRLQGPNAWPGARRAIVSVHERVVAPLNTRTAEPRNIIGFFTSIWLLSFFILIGALFTTSHCFS